MKKMQKLALYSVLLPLIMQPTCSAFNETSQQIVGGITAICTGITISACYIHNNIQHTQQEKERLRLQNEQQEKEKRKQQYHLLEAIKNVTSPFKELQEKNPRIETHSDKAREEILKKIMLLEGSATAFENKVNHLTQQCNQLEPEIAQEHKEELQTLSWIRQSINTNQCVSKQKNAERKEHLAKEEEDAKVRTVKLDASTTDKYNQTAQQHLDASQQTKKIVATLDNIINKINLEVVRRIEKKFDQLKQSCDAQQNKVADLLNLFFCKNSAEHHKTRDDVYASEQQIKKEISEIKKTAMKTEEKIAYIAQELESIKRLLLPIPSAPPAHAFPAAQNPAAQNPAWVPGVPPYVPQQ